MSARPENRAECRAISELLVFYVCEEVSEAERKRIEAHLRHCEECLQQLAEEEKLTEAVGAVPQQADEIDATGVLLAQCRSELAEALDDMAAANTRPRWEPMGWLRRWMALRPALSGACLLLLGIAAGTQVLPWIHSGDSDDASGQVMKVLAAPKLSNEQLEKMAVATVNVLPASDPASATVRLQLSASQPMEMSGNLEDAGVRRVLTYVVENGERFDPGVRLDCVEALKAVARDREVRSALLAAAKRDQNAAVRMKALDALRDSVGEEPVREALLDVLQRDMNPGVRVEAVNLLVRSLGHEVSGGSQSEAVISLPEAPEGPSDASIERTLRALERLQRQDPSRYVRLRSAAALRQIGPREVQ
jgi:HEAT repeat protein/putative zinc finger protein